MAGVGVCYFATVGLIIFCVVKKRSSGDDDNDIKLVTVDQYNASNLPPANNAPPSDGGSIGSEQTHQRDHYSADTLSIFCV